MSNRSIQVLHALWCLGGTAAAFEVFALLSRTLASADTLRLGDVHGAADQLERAGLITSRTIPGEVLKRPASRELTVRRLS